MELIAECAGLREEDLVTLRIPDATARELLQLHDAYFGQTAFTGKQRAAREAGQRHSLATLMVIERYAAREKTQREAWALRVELCRAEGSTSAIEKLARQRARRRRSAPSPGVRIYRRPGGTWTLAVTGPSATLADMYAAVDKQAPLESVERIFFGGEAGARQVASTNVIVTLDQLDQIVSGGGEEVTVRLTNGATMTGAELVGRRLAERGYVTLVHPEEGPVNLYRTQRLANWKQRMMAAAENPVCPGPDCNCPADEAQVHHLYPWALGGETNMRNLTTACGYHNAVNDDDPSAPPRRGRLVRRAGRVVWQPPWAG